MSVQKLFLSAKLTYPVCSIKRLDKLQLTVDMICDLKELLAVNAVNIEVFGTVVNLQ